MNERDVTGEIEWRKIPRVLGKWKSDEIWHGAVKIGYVEPMGPVLTHKGYELRLVPSRTSLLEQKIFKVERELEAKITG